MFTSQRWQGIPMSARTDWIERSLQIGSHSCGPYHPVADLRGFLTLAATVSVAVTYLIQQVQIVLAE